MSTSPSSTLIDRVSSNTSSLYVPPELLSEIFTHCDVPTLAAISRVSFACLELTAKLLYTDITLSDTKSIAMLLRLESAAGTPPSCSDRVSAHTSLSLIHSVTLYDEGELDPPALDAHKPFHPPIAIEVLAVSVATTAINRWGQGGLPRFNLGRAMSLFNPRILLLRGRRAPLPTPIPDITRPVKLQSSDLAGRSTRISMRLSVVIQSGAFLNLQAIFVLQACVAQRTGLPLRFVWDFLDVLADPGRQICRAAGISTMSFLCGNNQEEGRTNAHVRAWVGSQEIKDGVIASGSLFVFGSSEEAAGADMAQVPSARVRRLRDAFVEHGVKKDMDWDALDDL